MGRKPKVQTRIPQDTKDQLEAYCEEHDISQSDAVRRAVENVYGVDPAADVEGSMGAPSVTENPTVALSFMLSFLGGFIAMSAFALGVGAAALFVGVAILTAPVAYYAIAPAIVSQLPNDDQAASVEADDV